jgi:hypothetical protein
MDDKVKEAAVAYWQDKLAKFFPTSKGPTNCEIEMFKAGAEWEKANLEESVEEFMGRILFTMLNQEDEK